MLSDEAKDDSHIRRTSVVAWVIYDTGNTVFFVGIMGLVFPLWITTVMGGDDATIGFTLAASMAVVFLTAPILGAVSDHLSQRMLFLGFFTMLSVLSIFFIGFGGLTLSLVLFAVAVMAIHTADMFYNTILGDVSTIRNRGFIAGVGIGLGYIGAIVSVAIAILCVEPYGHVVVIRSLGVVMLILTAPLLLIGKDKPSKRFENRLALRHLVYASARRLMQAARDASHERVWMRFLVARFWYMWAVNASASFAVLYGVQTVGLSETQVQFMLILGIVTGIPSGAFWGKVVDRSNAARVLKIAVLGWAILLVSAALIPVLDLPGWLWGGVAVLSGVFVAGLYVAERPFIMSIAPEGRIGEYFGLNAMSGRLAAIAGPFSWGFISVTLGLGQSVAITWLAMCVFLAILLLYKLKMVSDHQS